MEIKEFIGKVVINPDTKSRYLIRKITSPYIAVETEKPQGNGHRQRYIYNTINGDPISNGTLMFEDKTLTEPFKAAYTSYCQSKAAYWEEYGYWMRMD